MITNEVAKDIVENILAKAFQQAENGRHFSALNYLSAISDYSDNLFNYEVNDQKINKLIKDGFKSINVRQAFHPFILT